MTSVRYRNDLDLKQLIYAYNRATTNTANQVLPYVIIFSLNHNSVDTSLFFAVRMNTIMLFFTVKGLSISMLSPNSKAEHFFIHVQRPRPRSIAMITHPHLIVILAHPFFNLLSFLDQNHLNYGTL